MGNTMLKGLLAAVAIAAAVESAFATGAKSYIQDGLIFHLDAIANNGVDANGNDVHASLSGANCWKEIVNDIYMKRTASKNVSWSNTGKYVDFAGDVAHTNRFPAVLQALRSRSLTAEIFLMPKTYKKWGGYLHLGDNGNHRYLTIEMGEDASTSPSYKGAFHRVQAYDSTWGNHSDIIIQTNTQYYFNKNVHVALTVDGAGSHLAFDDGPIIHTNPVGSLMPTFDVVKIGGYSTYPAAARYYAFRIYNRVLEDWEFKYNRELDKVRFLDAANVVMKILGLTAAGDVATHCEAYSGADGDAVTFTNSNLSSPSNTCTVVGYSHYDENGDLIASGSGGSYSCTLSKSTMLCSRLEWNVAVSNLLTVAAQGSGSVSAASGFRDAAVDAVLTAVPDAGSRFVRWEGDIPGNVNASGPELTLPMDRPRSVKAVFFTPSQSTRYISLDWIESTGREWIDAGVKVAGTNDVETCVQPLSCGITLPSTTFDNETSFSLYGGGDEAGVNEMKVVSTCVFGTNAYIKTCYQGSGPQLPDTGYGWYSAMSNMTAQGTVHGAAPAMPSVYTYVRSGGVVSFKLNGRQYPKGHTEEAFVSTNNFYIFNANTPGCATHPCNARLWYFKIYDSASGNLVRDFVPVKIAETGEVGLYDNVSQSFFGNASGEGAFIAGPMAQSEWRATDDGGFDYSVEWTIGGYTGSERLTNVPVLIRISEDTITGFSYSHCLANGSDLAFSSESDFSNRLPCEIDEWNTSGTSLVWVKVPVLSGTDTKLYMRYGRTTPAGNLPSTEVWGDYLAVWHLNGRGGAQGELDSSPRGNTTACALRNAPTVVDAKVGKGSYVLACNYLLSKNGLYKYVGTYDNMPQVFTASYWCKWDKFVANTAGLEVFNNVNPLGDVNRRYGWGWEWGSSATKGAFYYGKTANSPSGNFNNLGPTWDSGDATSWTYYTATTDGYNLKLYKNGSSQASNTYGSYIGGFDTPVRICGANSKAPATADEVRISREPLSAARIAADYRMMTYADFATADAAVKIRGSAIATVGDPVEYGQDVIPYGSNTAVSDGDIVTNAAPEFVFINGRTDYRAYCMGWDLYNIVNGEEVFLRASTNTVVEGESFTNAIITVDGAMKIVWHWKEQYYMAASTLAPSSASPGYGTVSGAGWYFDGDQFTLSATPAEGYRFLCWAGGAGFDTSAKLYSSSVTYTSGNGRSEYKAVFVPDDYDVTWLYIPSDSKVVRVTGPKWVFNGVTLSSGTRISVPMSTGHFVPSSASALDMSGPLRDLDGNEYGFYKFSVASGYSINFFAETTSGTKSKLVTSMVLPETFTTSDQGAFQFLNKCVSFDFLGKYGSINTRMFYTATSCRWIRFHYFPPTVLNGSDWTFYGCGGSADYGFRIEYPAFLENAWLCATNTGARYDYKNVMTASEKSSALTAYRKVFGSGAAEPNGYASLNFIKGENSPKKRCALVSYEAPVKSGKIALGIMGLPFGVAKAETMSPSYGYHEYATGEPIVVGAPRQFTELAGQPYLCKGYVLTTNPSVTNRYASSFTLPGDVDANIGVTWIWKEYSGFRGLVISVK